MTQGTKGKQGVRHPTLLAIAYLGLVKVATRSTCNQMHNKKAAQHFGNKQRRHMYVYHSNQSTNPAYRTELEFSWAPNRAAELGNDRPSTFFTCGGAASSATGTRTTYYDATTSFRSMTSRTLNNMHVPGPGSPLPERSLV